MYTRGYGGYPLYTRRLGRCTLCTPGGIWWVYTPRYTSLPTHPGYTSPSRATRRPCRTADNGGMRRVPGLYPEINIDNEAHIALLGPKGVTEERELCALLLSSSREKEEKDRIDEGEPKVKPVGRGPSAQRVLFSPAIRSVLSRPACCCPMCTLLTVMLNPGLLAGVIRHSWHVLKPLRRVCSAL